ncbi:MAG: hypothetical protein PF689_00840 [Deltaproteobacteria bacterium]|jgi:hypothetical protein|nr:hypothetical protein [Deltaproteobacteria bacterium]
MDSLILLTARYFNGKTTPVYSGKIVSDKQKYRELYHNQHHVDPWFEEEKIQPDKFIHPCQAELDPQLYSVKMSDSLIDPPSFPFNYFQPNVSTGNEQQQPAERVSNFLLGLYAKQWDKVDKLEFGSKNWFSSFWDSNDQEFIYRFDLKKLGLNKKTGYDSKEIAIIALLVYAKYCAENDSLNHMDLFKLLLKTSSWLASNLQTETEY